MRRLGEVTRKHRILLKPFFQDKDIAKIGRVSFTRMRSILDNNKIPLSDYQFTLLCKNFAYDGIEFNYLDFIESLKQYEGFEEWSNKSLLNYKIIRTKLYQLTLFSLFSSSYLSTYVFLNSCLIKSLLIGSLGEDWVSWSVAFLLFSQPCIFLPKYCLSYC